MIVTILIAVYNDWQSVAALLLLLDKVLSNSTDVYRVLLVDDASTHSIDGMGPLALTNIESVQLLELRRNLGNQKANAVGLCYLEKNDDSDVVVVMDGDGEDNPDHVGVLLQRCTEEGGRKIVFAARRQRHQGFLFDVFYRLYRFFHQGMTGRDVRIGNFSAIPRGLLSRLVVVSEIWSHFTAGIIRSKLPYVEIPLDRSRRLAGQSKMTFVALAVHGLTAISVHAETVGVRMLTACAGLIGAAMAAISIILCIRLWTDLAIPGWASNLTALFFVIIIQTISLGLTFVFTILSSRNSLQFLPLRDFEYFVLQHRTLWERRADNT